MANGTMPGQGAPYRAVRAKLEALAEPGFRDFSSALVPGLPEGWMLGVRLPALRAIARQVAKGDWRAYLRGAPDGSFEEVMLQGMVIGYADMPREELFRWIGWFLPKAGNWSVCDSFCAGLKAARRWPEEMWEYVGGCLQSAQAYTVRFGAVMLLNYYVDAAHLDAALARLDAVRHPDYYVKMAVAWAVSIYFAAFPAQTMQYLQRGALDGETYRKALQKILESRQVGARDKAAVRVLRDAYRQGNGGAHR
ncbi:DNA alkylation repair protein [Intestinibacillus massiliensis]|nr:DNA alkylation repair protein [Intestinibacillus massiliensis]